MSMYGPSTRGQFQTGETYQLGWGVKLIGCICMLFGLALLIGGIWLIALGGSWYYGIAGVGLIVSGILLNHGSILAVFLYLAVWTGTMIWAWAEAGNDWWAQVPRMLSPTIVLVAVIFCIPSLVRAGRAVRRL